MKPTEERYKICIQCLEEFRDDRAKLIGVKDGLDGDDYLKEDIDKCISKIRLSIEKDEPWINHGSHVRNYWYAEDVVCASCPYKIEHIVLSDAIVKEEDRLD